MQSSTFANPVYESIYNINGEQSINMNEEKKGLLQSTMELQDVLSTNNEHVQCSNQV